MNKETNQDDNGPPVYDISDDDDENDSKDIKDTSVEEVKNVNNASNVKEEFLSSEEKAEKYDVLKTEFSVLQNKLESLSKVLGSHGMDVGVSGPSTPTMYPPAPYPPYPPHNPYYSPGFHSAMQTPTAPAESSLSESASSEPTTPVVPKQEPQPYGWPNQEYGHQMYNQPWMQYPQYPPYPPPNGYPAPYPSYNYNLPYPPSQYPYQTQPPMPPQNTQGTLQTPNTSKPIPAQDTLNRPPPVPYHPPHHQPYPYYPQPPMPGQDPSQPHPYDPNTTHQRYPAPYGQPCYPPPQASNQNVETPKQNQVKEKAPKKLALTDSTPKVRTVRGRPKEALKPSFSGLKPKARQHSPEVETLSPPPTMPILSPQVKMKVKEPSSSIGHFDQDIQEANHFRKTSRIEPQVQTLYPPIHDSIPKTYQRTRKPQDVPRTLQGLSGVCVKKVTPPPVLPRMGTAVSIEKEYSPLSAPTNREVNKILSMSNLSVSLSKK